jgi:aspartate racemase
MEKRDVHARKTIGIIGGMGPLATVDIFERIVRYTHAQCDQEHIHILVDNLPQIPNRSEHILHDGESPLKYLVRSALRLEMMGADVLLMPCNTAHYFYDDIVKFINIPFINMIEETAKATACEYHEAVQMMLLATEGTCRSGIYEKEFSKYGIQLAIPDEEQQKQITDLIHSIKHGNRKIDPAGIESVLESMKRRGTELFILGCTELPLAFGILNIREKYIDPTDVLARCAVLAVEQQ